MSLNIETINKEIEFINRNQIEFFKLKSMNANMKKKKLEMFNRFEQTEMESVTLKIGQFRLFSLKEQKEKIMKNNEKRLRDL